MNVLHLAKFFYPDIGGIETVTKNICDNLSKVPGYKVDVVCFSNKVKKNNRKYKIFELKYKKIFSTPITYNFIKFYKIMLNKYDFLHIHLPNPMMVILLFFFRRNEKIIIHWHSDILSYSLLSVLFRPFEYWILKKSYKIILTSRNYLKGSHVLRFFIRKIIINNPTTYDLSKVKVKEKPNLFKKKKLNKKIILFVGRLVKYKGLYEFLQHINLLNKDCILVIVGDGPEKKKLHNLIKYRNLQDKVFFIERLKFKDYVFLLKNSFLFILPSLTRQEAFGMVLIEALSVGLPIINFNIENSGVNFVNKNNLTGFNIEYLNYNKFFNKINMLVFKKKTYKTLRKNSKIRFKNFFDIKKISMSKIYD